MVFKSAGEGVIKNRQGTRLASVRFKRIFEPVDPFLEGVLASKTTKNQALFAEWFRFE